MSASRIRLRRPAAVGTLLLWALAVAPARGGSHEVSVTVDPAPGSCAVRGTFRAAVPPETAWTVLADYDHIADFVRSMVTSRSERGADGRLQVRQTAKAGVFIFHKRVHVLLAVEEEPRRRIRFRDVLGQDFQRYVGEWTLEGDSTGTRVGYALEAEPKSAISRSLCRGVLRHTAEDLLEEVREEMLRRGAARP